MICETCAKVGDLNRRLFKHDLTMGAAYPHPHNCGCACQHRKPVAWVKFFSVKDPNAEDS